MKLFGISLFNSSGKRHSTRRFRTRRHKYLNKRRGTRRNRNYKMRGG